MSNDSSMRGVNKHDLPSKNCLSCLRPFTWRKSGNAIGTTSSIVLNAAAAQRPEKNNDSDLLVSRRSAAV